jgi:hypothetical protein
MNLAKIEGLLVISAEAGIQESKSLTAALDPRFRGGGGKSRLIVHKR